MIKKRALKSCRSSLLILSLFISYSVGFGQQSGSEGGRIKTVVIDAGHGGKDPGCNGAHANEKSVCLSMALKLGKMIKDKYPDVKVVYTRETDVFVELDERAKIANRNKADLFICIHANAASATAYGTETYVLGLHRSEAQQKVAERENSIIYLEEDGGEKYKGFDLSPDALIARQIQLSVFLDQSIRFADKLQTEFKAIGRHDRGVKQAGFLVLYKTTMPSVLIETGFLTNPTEELFLGEDAGQRKMAKAMFDAFDKYKKELEAVSGMVESDSKQDVSDNPQQINNENQGEVVFRVQIETSSSKLNLLDPKFKGNTVFEYFQDGLYKYTVGTFINNPDEANLHKNKLRSEGFEHAFVVAFLNGERISLQKAINLAKN